MLEIVGAVINDVVPDPVLYGICKFAPPAMFVAVVALVALVADVAVAALPPIDRLEAVPVRPVPAPLKDVALKTPVLGTKLNLVDDVVAPTLPVLAEEITGYQVAVELVLSVIAMFVAFVAVVAVVAVLAFPVNAPTKVVDVTEVKPAIVVAEPPKLIAVEPTVMLEFVSAELGIEVKAAPEPENPVAVKTPVEGLNWYLVDATYSVVKLPLVVLAYKG